jgi:protein-disulfide isomerase
MSSDCPRRSRARAAKVSALTVAPVLLAATLLAQGANANDPTRPARDDAGSAFTAQQKQEIETIVRDYLLRNPELLMEIGEELEKRQAIAQAAEHQKIIVEKKASIFAAPTDFVLGNPNGDITVVEFFDYNCSWCKRAVNELSQLTRSDPRIRIVFKEFPIFGEDSAFAAKAAMASMKQNKYWEFHVALMKERGQVTKETVFRVAEKTGLDVAKLKAEMANPAYETALKETEATAAALGIKGTPGFIVDTRVNVGFLPADGLRELVADVRKTGCQVC